MEPFPLLILLFGIWFVLGLIVGLRANAFLALLVAAVVVSILAPGTVGARFARVTGAFGKLVGSMGIVTALVALPGCLMFRRTSRISFPYLMAVATGGVLTHTLLPPTPGPLLIANTLNINLGVMIVGGALIGLPAAVMRLAFCTPINRRMPVPIRPLGDEAPAGPVADSRLRSWSPSPALHRVCAIAVTVMLEMILLMNPG